MLKKLLLGNKTIPLVTKFSQRSEIAEQYRVIRTRIMHEIKNNELQSLLVTSAKSGEGKSTVAANLAVVLSNVGLKVLLVDADLRTGSLTKGMRVNNEWGFSDLLSVEEEHAIVAHQINDADLRLLPSGPTQERTSELLGSEKMHSLIEKMTAEYDLIIFDTPPICEVADAQVLAMKLDGTILVVNEKSASEKQVKRAKDMIDSVQGNLIGAIANFSYR